MSHGFTTVPPPAPVDATYLVQVAHSDLTAEFALSTLATGYLEQAAGTPTSQAVPLPFADGGTGSTSFASTNGVAYRSGTGLVVTAEGATGQTLHGNTGAAPSYRAVSLTADVTGTLPIANGGTNQTGAYTAARVIIASGTALIQSAGVAGQSLSWVDASNHLCIGGESVATADVVLGADGSAVFNEQAAAVVWRAEVPGSSTAIDMNQVANTVRLFGGSESFASGEVVFNDNAADKDVRVEGQAFTSLVHTDASVSRVGIGTSAPVSTLHVEGGLRLAARSVTANTTYGADDFHLLGDSEAVALGITLTLPSAATPGRIFIATKINPNIARTVSVAPAAGQTIDGVAANDVISTQWTSRGYMADGGTNWLRITSKGAL